jgi:ribonuclease Z
VLLGIALSAFAALPAQAQSSGEIKVTLLGTGCPEPAMNRFGPSILVEAGSEKLIFDAGRGALQRLGQANVKWNDVTAVFFTHLHSDHVIGFPDLWLTGWLTPGRNHPVKVWGPIGTKSMLSHFEQAFAFDIAIRTADDKTRPAGIALDVTEVTDGAVYERGGVKVTTIEVDHEPIKPAFGYRIDFAGRSVVLSGDTRVSQNLIKHAAGVDVLIHEVAVPETFRRANRDPERARSVVAHHVTPEQAGEVFARTQPRLAVYSHIVLPTATAEDLIPATRKVYQGPLEVGEDLMVINVGRTIEVTPQPADAREAAREAASLNAALTQLTAADKFSGAVVIRDQQGVRFARGYGWADPFSRQPFTPETPVDSASLAKPVTAAVVLQLAKERKIDLDRTVRHYLPDYPHPTTTVRHLLAHSAGLPPEADLEPFANKTNEMLMKEVADRRLPPLFTPGAGFNYCNICFTTLALLIERAGGASYLSVAQERVALPAGVTIRPLRLADWTPRAIGYRRTPDGKIERTDSYESEAFYGSGNLSISASQLAQWGAEWWQPKLANIRADAAVPARIDGKQSGLSWGSWYCASTSQRCHYLGHHEGFHHMLYWDADRRISVAMVSNNTLAPGLQQRLQRALVAFAEDRTNDCLHEIRSEMLDEPVLPGNYQLANGENVTISSENNQVFATRREIRYRAYRIGAGIRYVPGLDTYLADASEAGLHWLNLYEDMRGAAK